MSTQNRVRSIAKTKLQSFRIARRKAFVGRVFGLPSILFAVIGHPKETKNREVEDILADFNQR